MPNSVSRSVEIAAPAQQVWELVSDLPGMGRYSPESTGGAWRRGATGPAVGAVFRGHNARGLRRWSTTSTVLRSEPGKEFAFAVTYGPLTVAQWSYALDPTASGCTLTETWTDGRGVLMRRLGPLATGVSDREAYAAKSMEQTLDRVKSHAEEN